MELRTQSQERFSSRISLKNFVESGLAVWENPLWAALLALLVYSLLATLKGPLTAQSAFPYYHYLADAFLHGQLHLRVLPVTTHDLVALAGKYYLYWPPMPAILLVPFVAVFGLGFSDILFTLGIAALNVAVVAVLLRQAAAHKIVELSNPVRGLVVLFFALGTVHVTLAPYGRVWYTGQLVAFLFVALGYLAAMRLEGWNAFFFSGLAFACAALTRNHLVFAGLWPAYYLLNKHWPAGWQRLVRYLLIGIVPLAIGLGAFAANNFVRFGSPLDVGLDHHQMDLIFVQDYQKYGAFNLHYLPINFHYQYLAYPFPARSESYMGGSLFLLSPLFLAAVWGLRFGRPRGSVLALAATILLVNVPILLLMGTGWIQFGPRYTLDFTVPLLLLTGMGIRRWPAWLSGVLALVSIVQYLYGTTILARVM